MLSYFLKGAILGASASITPGPFLAFLLSQTLQHGWKRTLPAAFAPLLSDGPIIILVMLVLTQTPTWFLNLIQLIGGFFLMYLAWGAWQAMQNPVSLEIGSTSTNQTILKGAFMNALSPGPYLFWSLLAGPIVLQGWREAPALGVAFMGGFYLMLIGGFMGFVILFGIARYLDPRVTKFLSGFSAVALFLFGIYQLWLSLTTLLG